MATMEFILSGDVAIKVIVTELDGALDFEVSVIQPGEDGYTGQIGELNGLFFDMAGDVDGFSSLTANDGVDDLSLESGEASVANLGGGINLNGEVVKDLGKFDVGIVTATTGLGKGDLQDITFTLTADVPLTLADVAGMDFGVRLTSVGEPDGSRDGSSKIGGTAPDAPVEEPPVNMATDDVLTVFENETMGGIDAFDFLDDGSANLLFNDTTTQSGVTSAYAGTLTGIEGTAVDGAPVTVTNADGGMLTVYSDGRVDFATNGNWDYLAMDEVAQTSFAYEIDGDAATLTVNIIGLEDLIGPGPGGGDVG